MSWKLTIQPESSPVAFPEVQETRCPARVGSSVGTDLSLYLLLDKIREADNKAEVGYWSLWSCKSCSRNNSPGFDMPQRVDAPVQMA